jgi:hypothetical protein
MRIERPHTIDLELDLWPQPAAQAARTIHPDIEIEHLWSVMYDVVPVKIGQGVEKNAIGRTQTDPKGS